MLSDTDRIRNLLGAYCERIDAGDFAGVGALFAGGSLADESGNELARGATAVEVFFRRTVLLHDGSPRTKHLVLDTVFEEPGPEGRTPRPAGWPCARRTWCSRPPVTGRSDRSSPGATPTASTARTVGSGASPSAGSPSTSPATCPGTWRGDGDRVSGRVVLVTGSASGIGWATAERFLADGDTVVGVDLTPAGPPGADARRADVSDTAAVRTVVAETLAAHGRLDVVANVAGIPQFGHVDDLGDAEWQRSLDVNLTGPFKVCRAALPALRASRGCIVNVASIAGLEGQAYTAAYCTSKGGLVLLTRALAVELSPDGVRVNCAAPARSTPRCSAGWRS